MPLQPIDPDAKPLEPMVIPFNSGNLSESWEIIGMKEQYITQLTKEMLRRAILANELDDDNKRMKELLSRYETELVDLRSQIASLGIELRQFKGEAGGGPQEET